MTSPIENAGRVGLDVGSRVSGWDACAEQALNLVLGLKLAAHERKDIVAFLRL
jgi:hypothetical protein